MDDTNEMMMVMFIYGNSAPLHLTKTVQYPATVAKQHEAFWLKLWKIS